MNSRTRQACYPRGSLSVRTGSHQRTHCCSLSPTFVPATHFVKITISPTFVFNPLHPISDRIESNFGRLCYLIEGVPPQSNRPPAAVLSEESKQRSQKIAVSHFCLSAPRKGRHNGSCLRFDLPTVSQQQAAVKLHGVFVSP